MKSLIELDHLNLDPAAKQQVAAMVQALLDQVDRDTQLLQLKELEIQEKMPLFKPKTLKSKP